MIHKFRICLQNNISDEEVDSDCYLLMSEVVRCHASMDDPEEETSVLLKSGDTFLLKIKMEDFHSIWETCICEIKI